MRKLFLLKTMLLLCALIVGSSSMWADDVTFNYLNYKGEGTQSSGSEYTMAKSYVSIKNTKFYGNTSYAQFYAGGVTTITPATGVTITGIVLTASSTGYNGYQGGGEITPSKGEVDGSTSSTTVTWTGSETSAFTISNNKQIRWTKIVVTYTPPTSDTSTSVTIDDSGITNTNLFYGTAAGKLSATVKDKDGNAINGATVTWTSGTQSVATIASDGTVTLVSAGTTEITASYAGVESQYDSSSATYELTVTNVDPDAGTATKPYTVAQARAAIDAGTGVANVYATGIVSEIVTALNLDYGNITYNISADGLTTSDQLQAYRGKSYNGNKFTSADDIQVGDEVVVYGNLTKYGSTYEFAQDNQLVSLVRRPATPTFSPAAGTYSTAQNVTITCDTEGADIYYTTNGSDPTANSTKYTEAIAVNATTTIKAIAVKDNVSSAVATATFTIDLSPIVTVDPYTTNVGYAATNGTLAVTALNYDLQGTAYFDYFTTAEGTGTTTRPDWIELAYDRNNQQITYAIAANEGEARTVYFKLVFERDEGALASDMITITQAKYVKDYADLPFAFNGGKADIDNTVGLTQSGLGNDYSSSPKLKFDNTGDYLILKINEAPGKLSFDIQNNSFSGGTFTVQTSADGVTYTDLKAYTTITKTQSEEFDNLDANVRYIKWIYTNKSSGNVGLGNIALEQAPEASAPQWSDFGDATILVNESFNINVRDYLTGYPYPTLSMTPDVDNEDCTTSFDTTTGDFTFKSEKTGEYKFVFTATNSKGSDSRTLFITVKKPDPVLTVTPENKNVSAEASNGTLNVTPQNFSLENVTKAEFYFYDEEGTALADEDEPKWITLGTNDDYTKVTYEVVANTGEARTARFSLILTYRDDNINETVFSNEVTFTQAAPAVTNTYTLATSITSGKHYVIASGTTDEADEVSVMSGQNSNNRSTAQGTVSDKTLKIASDAGAAEVIIFGPDASGNYSIWDADYGYLYASGNSNNNHLKSQETNTIEGKWTIDIDDETGEATIIAQGTNSNRYMRFNSSNNIFSCYKENSSIQALPYLYAKDDNEIEPSTVTLTLNDCGYATYASTKVLDFLDNEDANYSAWQVSSISGTEITYSQLKETIKPGTGILLKGKGGKTITLNALPGSGKDLSSSNKLVGITEATDVAEGEYYGLYNDSFLKVGAGTVPANKALLPATAVPSSARQLSFVFDEEGNTTGVTDVNRETITNNGSFYNLNGQRVANPTKGLYIVNGKKVVVK